MKSANPTKPSSTNVAWNTIGAPAWNASSVDATAAATWSASRRSGRSISTTPAPNRSR